MKNYFENLNDELKAYFKILSPEIPKFLDEYMIIGTSAMIETELDCIVNQYTEKFSNPMVMWGKYRKHWFKTILPISFQFHHSQMDGSHAARFLDVLQREITQLK